MTTYEIGWGRLSYELCGAPMDTFVVSLNVELFRRLLERETDEPRRQAFVRLLAQEEAKLVELDGKLLH
jgi:hypothetical protein